MKPVSNLNHSVTQEAQNCLFHLIRIWKQALFTEQYISTLLAFFLREIQANFSSLFKMHEIMQI